ncbi:hypothetical protein [Enterococcus sp.]|uniref:hypothetical protein n=1 Tax=Enterococcus sp. TaxID=35783 RepID=UPI00289F6A62|nr:hypothetical protein [Enterococcus sp.]
MKKGDFATVIKSKVLTAGTFVEILDELAKEVFLCGTNNGENHIVVAKNLEKIL